MLIEFILLRHGPCWILKVGAKRSKNYLVFTCFTSFDYLKRNYNYKSVFRSFNMPSRGKIRMILPLCCCNDENFHQYVSINSFKRYWRYLCTVESRTNLLRISPRYIRSGTKLSLLTETLTGSLLELKRLSTWDFTLTTSTGTVELRFLKRGCLQKKKHDNRPHLPLPRRVAGGSVSSSHNANNALARNPPTMSEVWDTPITNNHGGTNSSTQ